MFWKLTNASNVVNNMKRADKVTKKYDTLQGDLHTCIYRNIEKKRDNWY
jgi:hypothetical protein